MKQQIVFKLNPRDVVQIAALGTEVRYWLRGISLVQVLTMDTHERASEMAEIVGRGMGDNIVDLKSDSAWMSER